MSAAVKNFINFFLILLLTSLCLRNTVQAKILPLTLPSADEENAVYYTAGVVEFSPASFAKPLITPAAQLADNLQGYIEIIESVDAVPTDILVFPELSINSNEEASYVPDPFNENIAPCDYASTSEYHNFLVQLSCLARKHHKYIVINICEKAECLPHNEDPRPCASDGLNIFNTNVVFDRDGFVISRYRKVHLYGEPRNTTLIPDYGYFDTDFGVRFGHFVCFDILFYAPAQELVHKYGIKDFIFPTMWFSQLPFLTAVQIQSAWSYANDVNFLAAGASFPPVGTTGTGIYAGRQGTLTSVMSTTLGVRNLYVARLKTLKRVQNSQHKIQNRASTQIKKRTTQDDIYLKRDGIEHYTTLQVNFSTGTSLKERLCFENTSFCCNFEMNWRHLNASEGTHYYQYRLGVLNALRKEEAPETNKLRNCAIFTCIGDNIDDCGRLFAAADSLVIEPQVQIEKIVIEAYFPNATEMLLMPSTLKDDLLTVDVGKFDWQVVEESSMHKARFTLNTTIDNLLTFAIYGNYYDSTDDKDQCPENERCGGGGSTTYILSILVLLACVLVSNVHSLIF